MTNAAEQDAFVLWLETARYGETGLQMLRRRYVDGQITLTEFEHHLPHVLEREAARGR